MAYSCRACTRVYLWCCLLALAWAGAGWGSAPAVEWVQRGGGASTDVGYAVAATPDGGALVTGIFTGRAVFGSVVLYSRGLTDAYLAKYTANGTLAWVRQMGGTDGDFGQGVAATPDGGALVTGYFSSVIILAPGVTLTSRGLTDAYLAKYTATGALVWARQVGGSQSVNSDAVSATADGGALITGAFSGDATFAPGVTLTTSAYADVFVAQYTADGTLAWARQAGGSGDDLGMSVAAAPDGGALVTGYVHGIATFAPGVALTSRGDTDIFLARYAADGALAWVRQAGGSQFEIGRGVAVTADGAALVTGYFSGTATFAPGVTLTSTAAYHLFLARYAADGTLTWARQAGGSSHTFGMSVTAAPDGGALVCGAFDETTSFTPGVTLTSAGYDDFFLARYAADGALAWAQCVGSAAYDTGRGVAVTPDGGIFTTGEFAGAATFAPGLTVTSNGESDLFLAKYRPEPVYRPDLWLRNVGEATFTGDNVYAATGAGQTKAQSVVIGGAARYGVLLENDGNVATTFRLTVAPLPAGWTLSCWDYVTASDVTPMLLANGWLPTLAPGKGRKLMVTVVPGPSVAAGSAATVALTAVAADDPAHTPDAITLTTTALAPAYQPDAILRIAAETNWVGEHLYNVDATNQTLTQTSTGDWANYILRVANDGNTADAFTCTAAGAASGWRVKYVDYLTGADITAAMTGAGWVTPRLLPGQYRPILVFAKPITAAVGSRQTQWLKVISVGNPLKKDLAKAVTTKG